MSPSAKRVLHAHANNQTRGLYAQLETGLTRRETDVVYEELLKLGYVAVSEKPTALGMNGGLSNPLSELPKRAGMHCSVFPAGAVGQ